MGSAVYIGRMATIPSSDKKREKKDRTEVQTEFKDHAGSSARVEVGFGDGDVDGASRLRLAPIRGLAQSAHGGCDHHELTASGRPAPPRKGSPRLGAFLKFSG
jgi:hypothetical protein